MAARAMAAQPATASFWGMSRAHDFGRLAENAAAEYLARAGWSLLDRNWRLGHREIDIVARRGDVVAFIEVKARRTRTYGHPLDAITRAKRREIETVARAWIVRHGGARDIYRFDAVWVVAGAAREASGRDGDDDGVAGPLGIHHIQGAWRL